MAPFLNVCGVLVKAYCVQCYSKIFEAVNNFDCFIIAGDGVLRWRGTNDYFCGFTDVKVEVINLTPVGEVCDGVVIVLDGVIACD